MGIYDRDYQRGSYGEPPGFNLSGARSLTTNLLLVMIGVYVVQVITRGPAGDSGGFTNLFSLHADFWRRPWLFFQLLTYGFLHDPFGILHLVFNGITFWIFGRAIEERYGRREFLVFFLVSIVFAAVCWWMAELVATGGAGRSTMLGASGGIAAVLTVYILNYPRNLLYIWGVLPVPAWLLGVFLLANDVIGAVNRSGNVAYTAHLGGVLFGFLYFRGRWRLSDMVPMARSWPKFRLPRKHNLRVHDPGEVRQEEESEVDEILRKIQRQGQDSLTSKERRILERASKEYQRKRQ